MQGVGGPGASGCQVRLCFAGCFAVPGRQGGLEKHASDDV